MRFESAPGGGGKRPPNYFSRRVQYRLLLLVSMFMLVLVMMERVRDPRMWDWLWSGEQPAAAPPPEPEDVNTWLTSPLQPDEAAPQATVSAPPLGELPDADSPRQRAELDLWARILQATERPQQELLDRALKRARDGRRLPPDMKPQWQSLLDQFDSQVQRFVQQAEQATATAELDAAEQQQWSDVLGQIASSWQSRLLPALRDLTGSSTEALPASGATRQACDSLQQTLDALAMAKIKDNTVMRPDERRAWFRLLEQLQRMSAAELAADNNSRVGFVQLYQQPEVYRGRLVTVHGTAELAYRLQAPSNPFDIEQYYVFWIRPTGGPDSPLVVYSLDLPPGFPPVKDRQQEPGDSDLSEEVDITGYYFKNWAYRSKEGINTAPLILARAPRWTPAKPLGFGGTPVAWPWILGGVAAIALLSVLLAVVAFRSSVVPARPPAPAPVLDALTKLPVQDTRERLRRMAEPQDRR
jgi:hypothetical protein